MSIFNVNGRLYAAMSWLGQMLMLNLCWLLCCLPVLTAGAATTAAYAVLLKLCSGHEGYVVRDFFKAFRQNWKQGTVLWFITVAALYALYLDVQIVTKTDAPVPVIVISIVAAVSVALSLLYAYPLCARYSNSVRSHLRNSFLLGIRHAGRTLFLLAVLALEAGIVFWNEKTLILLLLIGPMLFMYTVSGTAMRIFLEEEKKTGQPPER